jgi:hypothetical protein
MPLHRPQAHRSNKLPKPVRPMKHARPRSLQPLHQSSCLRQLAYPEGATELEGVASLPRTWWPVRHGPRLPPVKPPNILFAFARHRRGWWANANHPISLSTTRPLPPTPLQWHRLNCTGKRIGCKACRPLSASPHEHHSNHMLSGCIRLGCWMRIEAHT